MANPKDPAKPVARSPGFWENLMSPKPKGPATSLRNATRNPGRERRTDTDLTDSAFSFYIMDRWVESTQVQLISLNQ